MPNTSAAAAAAIASPNRNLAASSTNTASSATSSSTTSLEMMTPTQVLDIVLHHGPEIVGYAFAAFCFMQQKQSTSVGIEEHNININNHFQQQPHTTFYENNNNNNNANLQQQQQLYSDFYSEPEPTPLTTYEFLKAITTPAASSSATPEQTREAQAATAKAAAAVQASSEWGSSSTSSISSQWNARNDDTITDNTYTNNFNDGTVKDNGSNSEWWRSPRDSSRNPNNDDFNTNNNNNDPWTTTVAATPNDNGSNEWWKSPRENNINPSNNDHDVNSNDNNDPWTTTVVTTSNDFAMLSTPAARTIQSFYPFSSSSSNDSTTTTGSTSVNDAATAEGVAQTMLPSGRVARTWAPLSMSTAASGSYLDSLVVTPAADEDETEPVSLELPRMDSTSAAIVVSDSSFYEDGGDATTTNTLDVLSPSELLENLSYLESLASTAAAAAETTIVPPSQEERRWFESYRMEPPGPKYGMETQGTFPSSSSPAGPFSTSPSRFSSTQSYLESMSPPSSSSSPDFSSSWTSGDSLGSDESDVSGNDFGASSSFIDGNGMDSSVAAWDASPQAVSSESRPFETYMDRLSSNNRVEDTGSAFDAPSSFMEDTATADFDGDGSVSAVASWDTSNKWSAIEEPQAPPSESRPFETYMDRLSNHNRVVDTGSRSGVESNLQTSWSAPTSSETLSSNFKDSAWGAVLRSGNDDADSSPKRNVGFSSSYLDGISPGSMRNEISGSERSVPEQWTSASSSKGSNVFSWSTAGSDVDENAGTFVDSSRDDTEAAQQQQPVKGPSWGFSSGWNSGRMNGEGKASKADPSSGSYLDGISQNSGASAESSGSYLNGVSRNNGVNPCAVSPTEEFPVQGSQLTSASSSEKEFSWASDGRRDTDGGFSRGSTVGAVATSFRDDSESVVSEGQSRFPSRRKRSTSTTNGSANGWSSGSYLDKISKINSANDVSMPTEFSDVQSEAGYSAWAINRDRDGGFAEDSSLGAFGYNQDTTEGQRRDEFYGNPVVSNYNEWNGVTENNSGRTSSSYYNYGASLANKGPIQSNNIGERGI